LNSSQKRIYDTGRRIQAFLDTNNSLLNGINKSGMRSELDSVLAALGEISGKQAAGRVKAIEQTAVQRGLLSALRRNHMQPIASVARMKARTIPNLKAMTMASQDTPIMSLLAHAHGMAGAAQPYARVFVDAGLAEDFIAKLRAAADAVQASIDTRAAARAQRFAAMETLGQLENGARLVLKALNALIVPILSADVAHSGRLAEWRNVRRIDSPPPIPFVEKPSSGPSE
jgi:hypothetical protein